MESDGPTLAQDSRIRGPLIFLVWLVCIAFILGLLRYAQPGIEIALTVLSPFIVGFIVAYIFDPIVRWFQLRFRVSRVTGVALAYMVIVGAFGLFLMFLVPVLYVQVRQGIAGVAAFVPAATEKATDWLQGQVSAEDIEKIRAAVEGRVSLDNVAGKAGPVVAGIAKGAAGLVAGTTGVVVTAVGAIVGFVVFAVFVALVSFYFLLDFRGVGRTLLLAVPEPKRQRVSGLVGKIDASLSGYFRGQLTVCVIVAVLYSAGLFALGMKSYAVLVGCMAGFGNLIPYFGPIAGGVPTVLWVIFSGAYHTTSAKLAGVLGVLVLSSAIQTLDGFYLQPRIVGKNADLPPLLVMLALVVGAQFGIGGMVLAVPTAIVARTLLIELWWNPLKARSAQPDASGQPVNAQNGPSPPRE